jgi:hypothetical protein
MVQEVKLRKTMLCLANSRKMAGRCLAGKEMNGSKISGWIRPVSGREHQEISVADRRYKDGTLTSLLDIVFIPMLEAKPGTYQSENYLIADQYYWQKMGSATWEQIEKSLDAVPGALWTNGHSSGSGQNDRIPEADAAKLTSSLLLVKPEQAKIVVAPKGDPNAPEKRSVRVRFVLNKLPYNLGLTDAVIEEKYLKGKNGTFPVADAILCVSLGEPFNGFVYKLGAALITRDRVGKSDG